MLIPEPTVIEVVILKREDIGGELKVWENTYHFLSDAEFDTASAYATLHMAVLAEQHIYPHSVAITTAVAYPIDAIIGVLTPCYSWPCQRIGGRSLQPGESVLPYEYAYCFKKISNIGRSGRAMHRRVLTNYDVHTYPDGRIARKATDDITSLPERFYDEYLRQGVWKPVNISLDTKTGVYDEPREITKFAPSHCVLLRTIADAQTRKTYIAQSYKAIALETLVAVETCDRNSWRLLNDFGDMIPSEELIAHSALVSSAQGGIDSTILYWSEGYAPALSPTWRPTEGLVEFDPISLSLCGAAKQNLSKYMEALTALIMSVGETATRAEFLQIQPFLWRAVTFFVRMIGRERFTGTPIPHLAL